VYNIFQEIEPAVEPEFTFKKVSISVQIYFLVEQFFLIIFTAAKTDFCNKLFFGVFFIF